jgi:hypothetical protein
LSFKGTSLCSRRRRRRRRGGGGNSTLQTAKTTDYLYAHPVINIYIIRLLNKALNLLNYISSHDTLTSDNFVGKAIEGSYRGVTSSHGTLTSDNFVGKATEGSYRGVI